MIVKNESHIIQTTLEKICSKIKLDYWVICDTGSTDNTPQIICDFFKKKGIKGEIYFDNWVNFAHNRTLALERAYNKTDLLFIFDADDDIVGNLEMPTEVNFDEYNLRFGSQYDNNYNRVLLINNKKKFVFKSVIHEFITCIEGVSRPTIIEGDYYVISGRSGSRNSDPNKYLNDALILEKAYAESLEQNDDLYHRYAYYCANSYKDFGKYEDAIKWYKITLSHEKQWDQEKYTACLYIFECYRAMNQSEHGFFYLVKSLEYDRERAECLYELINHYCSKNQHEIAYGYYTIVKSFYNDAFLNKNFSDKLFFEAGRSNLHFPFYMILVADKVKDYDTVIQMFRIIFTKKHREYDKHFIGNLLYNIQFFIDYVKDKDEFKKLLNDYIDFLIANQYPIHEHEFMLIYEKYGIDVKKLGIKTDEPVFSIEECAKSKKILIYSGYAPYKWNYTYSVENAMGGSETAIACLSKNFPKEYEIYVTGEVKEEKFENITYVNSENLKNLIKTIAFHSIIVSRYLNFYELYPNFSAYQTFIWGHDIDLYTYGANLSVIDVLTKWSSKITGCVCQTEWHKNRYLSLYPQLEGKITTINNGIQSELFKSETKKGLNRFIYSSCSERGLSKLIQLWPRILENLPDAKLVISSYNPFPNSEEDHKILEYIQKTPSIRHVGRLNKEQLYTLMSIAEYWLYPSYFPETSCITSLEMLASEVICLYYPVAGLVNTIGDYGIPIAEGNEIETLLDLSVKRKNDLKKKGRDYALNCSWKNRAIEWCNMMCLNGQINEKNNIKVINLKRREDRKNAMIEQFERENVKSYEFIEAVDGNELTESEELRLLFERNNFDYRKGIMGCALSHLHIWNTLIQDNDNNYYVVLEDDIELSNDFKEKLNEHCKLFEEQQIEHLSLGLDYYAANYLDQEAIQSFHTNEIKIIEKDVYKLHFITFAYIISKNAAKKMISFINKCSIKSAADHPQTHGEVVKYHQTTNCIAKQKHLYELGSDIQNDNNNLRFIDDNKKQDLRISYCDWWYEEYCGGYFDFNNNFITDILRKFGNIGNLIIVAPNENPDVLLYSIFGNEHMNYPNVRRVFFSGEPFGIRKEADFNFTFDRTSDVNIRFPLWKVYVNDYLFEECDRRKNGIITVPKKEYFCSFIANDDVKAKNRRTIVEKLSKYKKVHCGGNLLNNIGYNVPRGVNCSGKIEHNNKYKFAIAFENEDYPGYVTEKICDIYKSNCIPIYWGTTEVVNDFNPSTFINARNFANFDELVEYIIKVDNDYELYASFFKEPFFRNKWMYDYYVPQYRIFDKNLADCIIGKNKNLYYNYLKKNNKELFPNEITEIIINDINKNTYSQASQDVFVTNILQHKKNGYFVEIGSNDPIIGNNTYLLEKEYNFKGLLIEYDNFFENSYKIHRPNSIYKIDDARKINYKKLLDDNNFPKNIDYLQIDLDVDNKSTLDTLLLLNETVFDTYKFSTITFEHDIYRGDFFNTRKISREIFKNRGYLLIFPDISTDQGCIGTGWQSFEDWYVHPELVDMYFVNIIIKNIRETRNDYIKNKIISNFNDYIKYKNNNKKMKVVFSNNCSVGDIYFSQPFIKNIITNNPEHDYYIYHQTTSYYFTDFLNIKDVNKIPEFKEKLYELFDFKIDVHNLINIHNMSSYTYRYDAVNNILLICTWLGCIRDKYPTMIECNMISYSETYCKFINDINRDLSINLKYDNTVSLDVYPSIPTLNIDKYRIFKKSYINKKIIFYYNFMPYSGQKFPLKNNEEHNKIISVLAENNIVVLTSKLNYNGNNNNVYFADDFLENVEYYDAKNFYYYAQMANESDYSIYFDFGRGFMCMNKTFIEENNKNIRIHLSNNEFFYKELNCNILVPNDYLKFIKVDDYYDVIDTLQNIIITNMDITNNNCKLVDYMYIKSLIEAPNQLCFEWNIDFLDIALNSLNHLYKLGVRQFYLQKMNKQITSIRHDIYYDINTIKDKLIHCEIKNCYGIIYCCHFYYNFHGECHMNKHVDETLREYFPDYNYKGVFFDIGAYHPTEISNSYHFEKNGWGCYCFEANTHLIPLLREYRRNVFNYAISNENKDSVNFQIYTVDSKSSPSFSSITINEEYKQIFYYNPEKIIEISVPQRTIDWIIENEIPNLYKIDIISLDIEGGELNCLYGFNFAKYKPKIILIENVVNTNLVNEHICRFGYKLDKRIYYNEYYIRE
jgi:FkbM family methyltransferase